MMLGTPKLYVMYITIIIHLDVVSICRSFSTILVLLALQPLTLFNYHLLRIIYGYDQTFTW